MKNNIILNANKSIKSYVNDEMQTYIYIYIYSDETH